MKITAKWNSGNFALTHVADVPDEAIPAMLADATIHNCQRMSKIDEILGVVEKRNGKVVRVSGIKKDGTKGQLSRIDVPYSDDKAQALFDLFGKFTVKIGEKEVEIPLMTAVERYDREAGGAYKFTREIARFEQLESDPKDSIEKWLAAKSLTAGNREFVNLPVYVGPTHGDDGEYHPDALRAAREKFAVADAQIPRI